MKDSAGKPKPDAFAKAPPEMTILSDHPIRDAMGGSLDQLEVDAFELDSRLGAVFDIIRHQNTRTPMAIGIFGDWGTGKSSAMRWLAEQLDTWSEVSDNTVGDHFRTRSVWFEPWKYQTRDDVWRGLIAEVILSSIDVEGASVTTVVNAVKQFGGFLGRSFIRAASSIKLKPKVEGNAGVGKASLEAEINLDALTKIAEDYKQTAHPEKAFLNEFESTLKSWVASSLKENRERMVLFIDDLDRCLPSVVLEVLEALKLYLNIPQLVFVIGLDKEVVRAVIREHYKKAGLEDRKADSYLDKMFQVEAHIAPSERSMTDYLKKQIERLDAATNGYWSEQLQKGGAASKEIIERVIGKLAVHNPREIKRLLNSTLLGGVAAARKYPDKPLSFAQGCQAYLIGRIIRVNTGWPESIILREETWAFLVDWSKFVRDDHPGFAQKMLDKLSRVQEEPEGRDAPQKSKEDEAAEARLAELRKGLPRDASREQCLLMDRELLWELLWIPCSAEVGQAVAGRAADLNAPDAGKVAASAEARPILAPHTATNMRADSHLAALASIVLSRIASGLKKETGQLTAADLDRVERLDMRGTEFGDEALRMISDHQTGLKGLEILDLSNTAVTNEGVKALAGPSTCLQNLMWLSLNGTAVTDEGVKDLADPQTGLKNLTTLFLSGTAVSDEGAKALADPQTGLKNLAELYLSYTRVTDEGAKALADPNGGLKNLSALVLTGTKVTKAQAEKFKRLGLTLFAHSNL